MPLPITWMLCFLFAFSVNADYSTQDWWWSYTCNNGQCIRSNDPNVNSTPAVQNLLNVCRISCGQYGSLWPQPSGHTAISSRILTFHPSKMYFDLNIVGNKIANDFVVTSTNIFLNNLFTECEGNCSIRSNTEIEVSIKTTSPDLSLTWRTDEGYTIALSSGGNQVSVEIEAATVFGARHGLETLSQLITGYELNGRHGLAIVSHARISDKPFYSHRGLLLDTSRNFLPLNAIKRTLDGMAASKLNVFHWHATDSHSFPLESPRVPQLSRFGAYSAKEVYHPTDIAELISYAYQRGIQVILELDGPAHAGYGWQWGSEFGLGDLAVCVNQQPWRDYCIQPPCGQLNPSNPNLFKVMKDLFRDVIDLFSHGSVLHLGGDEVFFPCWNSTEEIVDWMQKQGLGRSVTDFLEVWGQYQETVLKLWDEQVGHDRTPIMLWSSHLTDPLIIERYLDKDRYIIETWVDKSDELPQLLLSKGYRVIFATKNAWYLDHGFWGSTAYYKWNVVYDNRLPFGFKGVLGGEVAMWGELVDEFSLDAKVWPRAAAMAERVWSNPDTSSLAAQNRMLEQRERLVRRSINAEAITPEWCYQNDGYCS
ncbi:beta-hexosaminidase 2 [Lycorma delicatula]|uniref:beta-hexosaminidase 2 n=1 Tax=Lycorma delicatula TaxID=130591 RepID=UPI003F51869F